MITLIARGRSHEWNIRFLFQTVFYKHPAKSGKKKKKKHTSPLMVLLASICYLQMRHTETPACSSETRGLSTLLPFTLAKITASSESLANRGGETVNYEG